DVAVKPSNAGVSVATLAELQVGLLLADDPAVRAERASVLAYVERRFEALPIDRAVAAAYAELVARARRRGRRPRPIDALIAATAIVHRVPVYTRDRDYVGLPGVEVVLVG
ncbi:MAG: PIN domain-containing protein, partial [Chloroflexota bacterium]